MGGEAPTHTQNISSQRSEAAQQIIDKMPRCLLQYLQYFGETDSRILSALVRSDNNKLSLPLTQAPLGEGRAQDQDIIGFGVAGVLSKEEIDGAVHIDPSARDGYVLRVADTIGQVLDTIALNSYLPEDVALIVVGMQESINPLRRPEVRTVLGRADDEHPEFIPNFSAIQTQVRKLLLQVQKNRFLLATYFEPFDTKDTIWKNRTFMGDFLRDVVDSMTGENLQQYIWELIRRNPHAALGKPSAMFTVYLNKSDLRDDAPPVFVETVGQFSLFLEIDPHAANPTDQYKLRLAHEWQTQPPINGTQPLEDYLKESGRGGRLFQTIQEISQARKERFLYPQPNVRVVTPSQFSV